MPNQLQQLTWLLGLILTSPLFIFYLIGKYVVEDLSPWHVDGWFSALGWGLIFIIILFIIPIGSFYAAYEYLTTGTTWIT